MRWARLLRTPERVEVLEINTQTQKARILRYGFVQEIDLGELVLEEEGPSASSASLSSSERSKEGVRVSLHLTAGSTETTLSVQRDAAVPAYVGLYVRPGGVAVWHPLCQEVFSPALVRLFPLSFQTYPYPWTLRLYVLPLLAQPEGQLPEIQIYESSLRPLFFAKSGICAIEWNPLSLTKPTKPSPISYKETTDDPLFSYEFPRREEIDLHIEKLAPHLASAEGEVIFMYQRTVLERYLDWAYREKLPYVRVIHGKGALRLRQLVWDLSKQAGWKPELLMTPPYSGGATLISFR